MDRSRSVGVRIMNKKIEFMKENKIIIFVEIDFLDNMIHIEKSDQSLEAYDLFQQLILYSDIRSCKEYIKDQILPRIWSQGNIHCILCKPNEMKLIYLFYNSHLSITENYFFAKEINKQINIAYNV